MKDRKLDAAIEELLVKDVCAEVAFIRQKYQDRAPSLIGSALLANAVLVAKLDGVSLDTLHEMVVDSWNDLRGVN